MSEQTLNKTIAFVNFSTSWAGGEVQHFTLAKELKRQGHRTIIITQSNSALSQRCKEENIEVRHLKVKKMSFLNPAKQKEIRKLLRSIQPDAVILNSSLELKHFCFATSSKHYNLIYRRGFHTKIKPKAINKYCFKRLNRVVAISEFVENYTLKALRPYCKNPISIINNGIAPLNDFQTPNYASKRLIAIGRLVPYKQFDVLIKAMPKILKTIPEAELWIVGEGEEKEHLEQIILDLKLKDKVILKGFRKDIPDLLAQSSLLVHPAKEEAFGVVFLEAMRQKLACITFRGHAGDEIIHPEETGLIVSDVGPNPLAKGIIKLLSDDAKREKMGLQAHERFNAHYTIEHSANQYLKLIDQH